MDILWAAHWNEGMVLSLKMLTCWASQTPHATTRVMAMKLFNFGLYCQD